MSDSERVLHVRRTNGTYSRFVVRTDQHTTLLDAFEQIRARHDPGFLYRHSCHHGSCGTCGVTANGERVLACVTPLSESEGEVHVDPLAPFPVIGDLAIDPASLYRDFPRDASNLRESDVDHSAEVPEEIDGFVRFENCIECGLCVSACPVADRFMGPAALAAYAREIRKRPERKAELLGEVEGPRGAQGCDRALECSRVCPLDVYPARHIADLRRMLDPET